MAKATKLPKDNAVLLPEGILSFVKIKEPINGTTREVDHENGKYSMNLILPADADLSALKDIIRQAAVDKLGEEVANGLGKAKKLKLPIRTGASMMSDKGELYAGYKEDDQVLPISFYRPMVFLDQFKNKIESDSAQASDTFYSGCVARVAVTARGFDNQSKGVSLRLYALMKTDDGERLGGGQVVGDADDIFADVDAAEKSPVTGDGDGDWD